MNNRIMLSIMGKARRHRVNRQYKDRLFRLIFQDKKDLLSLYNAISGNHYTDLGSLEIRTLEDAVYLGYKNDISFLISNMLNLYEHQSTLNPNMPLRGLLYFVDMLKAYIEEHHYNIYGEKLVSLPLPVYIVFYNGLKEQQDFVELKLSDAFGKTGGQDYALECKAVVLNINMGHNVELMERCNRLEEYAYFVEAVRNRLRAGQKLWEAIDDAIDECVELDKIADILVKNRAEVKNMLLTDFDERKYRKMLREEAQEEGREKGMKEGRKEEREKVNKLNRCLMKDGRMEDFRRSLEDKNFQEELLKEYGL